jgi:hypothetical protein
MADRNRNILINGLTCGHPMIQKKGLGAGAGTDGDENLLFIDNQGLEYHIIGTVTAFGWSKVAAGLRPPYDAADNEGFELCGGILSQDQYVYTVGTDAFHAALRFTADVLTKFEIVTVGFRKVAAYEKHADGVFAAGVTDLAAIGVYGDGNTDGSLYTITEVNNGGMTATDTTNNAAAATPCELRVNVDADGAVTFQIDLAANADPATAPTLVAPTTTQTFSFDDGDVVTPFVVGLRGAVTDGVLTILKLDFGLDDAA